MKNSASAMFPGMEYYDQRLSCSWFAVLVWIHHRSVIIAKKHGQCIDMLQGMFAATFEKTHHHGSKYTRHYESMMTMFRIVDKASARASVLSRFALAQTGLM